jgi:hypothetical protein
LNKKGIETTMRPLFALFALLTGVLSLNVYITTSNVNLIDECAEEVDVEMMVEMDPPSSTNCVSFVVGNGTGCSWMCNYCANQLGTNNYYFTDGICKYEEGGCVGSPVEGNFYTCCSV